MFEEEAETLCSHPALVAPKVEGRLQVIDVDDNLIAANGKGVKIVEVGKEKPDFRGVIAYGSVGISTCGERSGKFGQELLCFGVESRSFQIVFFIIMVNFIITER